MRDADAPCGKGEPQEDERNRRSELGQSSLNSDDVGVTEQGCDREVTYAPNRDDEEKKAPEPCCVDVERILARLDAAIGERIGDLEAFDRPERKRSLKNEDAGKQCDAAHDGPGEHEHIERAPAAMHE